MNSLPTFAELAENALRYAGPRDKTINIKITIQTARMMLTEDHELMSELRWIADQYDDTKMQSELAMRCYDMACVAKKLLAKAAQS